MRCRQITTRREGLRDPRPPVRPGPRPRKPAHKTELVSPSNRPYDTKLK